MAQQTAMQQLIKWMEDMSEVIPFDQGSCYDKAIELLQMEKEQLENARPQIISNCIIKEISDDEIEKAWNIVETTHVDKWVSFKSMFMEGAKWYREQLNNNLKLK